MSKIGKTSDHPPQDSRNENLKGRIMLDFSILMLGVCSGLIIALLAAPFYPKNLTTKKHLEQETTLTLQQGQESPLNKETLSKIEKIVSQISSEDVVAFLKNTKQIKEQLEDQESILTLNNLLILKLLKEGKQSQAIAMAQAQILRQKAKIKLVGPNPTAGQKEILEAISKHESLLQSPSPKSEKPQNNN